MKTAMFAGALLALALPANGTEPEPEPTPARVYVSTARDSEWHSYRRAWKAAHFFEAYTRTRPLIQAHMQIRPLQPDLPMEGLHIQLRGTTTAAEIPVDPLGRAELPLIKQAFEEDAVLRLNRHKGHYQFNGRYSIRERPDGVYAGADLRAACEQLLDAQRVSGYRWRLLGKRCAGVKFIYRLGDPAPRIVHRDAAGAERALPIASGQPFENATMGLYQVALYRFADWPAAGTVVAQSRPLGVGTLYE
ncbi:hypothetical protein [Massilia sp. Leaf139]|uniref:hypothetical protein n=1 Tax=Massilia sp. Leaf139 TaxID=1736272 RepID=UPI0006FCD09E|nr:hypothetical protein [Massilia sp. Leaf139]KQQ96454.1 hypothetical protein ASF77_00125 [Massilia sp. Leaf139]